MVVVVVVVVVVIFVLLSFDDLSLLKTQG